MPLEKANFSNTNKNANTDFLDTVLSPTDPPCKFRIQVCLTAAAKFKAMVTKAADTQTLLFNNDTNLTAGVVYTFDLLVHSGDTVNFQSDQNQTPIKNFRVQEILWAVQ